MTCAVRAVTSARSIPASAAVGRSADEHTRRRKALEAHVEQPVRAALELAGSSSTGVVLAEVAENAGSASRARRPRRTRRGLLYGHDA